MKLEAMELLVQIIHMFYLLELLLLIKYINENDLTSMGAKKHNS